MLLRSRILGGGAHHVPDGPLVEQVKEAQHSGKRITLRYSQWMISGLQQDSNYDITSVEAE